MIRIIRNLSVISQRSINSNEVKEPTEHTTSNNLLKLLDKNDCFNWVVTNCVDGFCEVLHEIVIRLRHNSILPQSYKPRVTPYIGSNWVLQLSTSHTLLIMLEEAWQVEIFYEYDNRNIQAIQHSIGLNLNGPFLSFRVQTGES